MSTSTYTALIACRTGMGSSMMLKIKVQQVINALDLPIEVNHDTLDAVKSFKGDLLITMSDLADELRGEAPYVIGIENLMNKEEIAQKLQKFINDKTAE
ncbi:PTS system, lactose/cellobiose-specific IIB subunit [Coriobacteriaceae bacterium BV3Ac1]|uniref:PTS sugar transporter subunit IIB n=1 Tax=Olegusella massiliensis TaxID=1776381 RepID=UPI0003ADB050|nr:PTS sugar transporter subunit IIB [Olegusella massiliensis]ERL12772.1 PTS system, lactose/cellobiose-specific IIB subunit [Coriobacteriaceae bacterium BV3Ac1]MBS5865465.1 PTS sugar transporter subunit IIB [Coriobacteriaceae bacterium]